MSYVSPLGETLEEDDDLHIEPRHLANRKLLECLTAQGESYWQNPLGAGAGGIELIVDAAVVGCLSITRLDAFGFWLSIWQKDADRTSRQYIAINEHWPISQWGELHFGGEMESWPAIFFHPPERALEVIEQYCALGVRARDELPGAMRWILSTEAAVDRERRSFNQEIVREEYCNYRD